MGRSWCLGGGQSCCYLFQVPGVMFCVGLGWLLVGFVEWIGWLGRNGCAHCRSQPVVGLCWCVLCHRLNGVTVAAYTAMESTMMSIGVAGVATRQDSCHVCSCPPVMLLGWASVMAHGLFASGLIALGFGEQRIHVGAGTAHTRCWCLPWLRIMPKLDAPR